MLPVEDSPVTCPHLDYRAESDERSFETARAYCTVVDEFVQPMRADVCNDRYDLRHDAHCEIFLEHAETGGRGDAEGSR